MQFVASLLILLQVLVFTQAANETHYIGAVVEFSPTIGNVSENAVRFVEFIANAKNQDADIIVFPEIGLNGYGTCLTGMLTQVPDPKDKDCPCTNQTNVYTDAFRSISCAARTHKIYVAVNIAEILPCNNCPRGYLRYNTNVVFDRNGIVIARYRKYNLFSEPDTNITTTPELSVFDTDFGVTFGQFICFDVLFNSPAVELVKNLNIKHIIYSTAWFSELPFLTAIQAQQGWAYGQNVTFLGSGYNDPDVGSGGSGIYVGRSGHLVRIFPDEKISQLLVAAIRKDGGGDTQGRKSYHTVSSSMGMQIKRENLEAFVSAPLEMLKSASNLCHGEFCCTFSVETVEPSEPVSYRYRGLVFDGVRSFSGAATGGTQVCAITTCENDDVTSCGARVNPKHLFTGIKIFGKFRSNNTVQFPTTLVSGNQLLPFDSDQFGYESVCDSTGCEISMTLLEQQSNLITFGIYGRDFTKDGSEVTPAPSSAKSLVSTVHVMIMSLAVINYYR